MNENENVDTEILFAEENPASVQVIFHHLKSINHHTRARICYSGDELVSVYKMIVNKALENNPPGPILPVKLVFTEQKMPKMLGTEAIDIILKFIEEKNQTSSVMISEPRFIVFTAYRTIELKQHL